MKYLSNKRSVKSYQSISRKNRKLLMKNRSLSKLNELKLERIKRKQKSLLLMQKVSLKRLNLHSLLHKKHLKVSIRNISLKLSHSRIHLLMWQQL